ncbi:MAG: ABC transporter ATP-binding protein, partial [Myxococcota bacterium]
SNPASALAGFERVHRGCIALYGDTVDKAGGRYLPPEKRQVGLVFQDYALFPHLNVARNIGFGMPRADPMQIAAWLERVGLAHYGERAPSELSGGEQQRVALARALASQPRLMLFDEPFSNLDPELRRHLRLHTRALLRQERITAVFVTHDATEALTLGDRLSVMHQSRLLQSGTGQELYLTPHSREVALSVGTALFMEGSRQNATTALSPFGPLPLHPRAPAQGRALMVRPEQLHITSEAISSTTEGYTPLGVAQVQYALYLGPQIQLGLHLDGIALEAMIDAHTAPSEDTVHVALRGYAWLLPG